MRRGVGLLRRGQLLFPLGRLDFREFGIRFIEHVQGFVVIGKRFDIGGCVFASFFGGSIEGGLSVGNVFGSMLRCGKQSIQGIVCVGVASRLNRRVWVNALKRGEGLVGFGLGFAGGSNLCFGGRNGGVGGIEFGFGGILVFCGLVCCRLCCGAWDVGAANVPPALCPGAGAW